MARVALVAAVILNAASQYTEQQYMEEQYMEQQYMDQQYMGQFYPADDRALAPTEAPNVTWVNSAASVNAADSKHVIWQGPVLSGDPRGCVTFAWPGVKATLTIRGASNVSMSVMKTYIADAQRFRVYVDGVPTNEVALRGNEFENHTLAAGLDPSTTHSITLWYLSDPIPSNGNTISPDAITIRSFTVDSGGFADAPSPRKRYLQIIGDSWVSGNQISVEDGCSPDQAATYVSRLCELYRVNCSITALTGKGVFTNCCDDGLTMPDLYTRAVPGMPASGVVPIVPDAVLIHLGTNDMARWKLHGGSPKDPLIAGFKESYSTLLNNLVTQASNEDMPIFAAFGPGEYGDWIRSAVDIAGVGNVVPLNFSSVKIDGCIEHPGFVGHHQMYEQSRPVVEKLLGWLPGDASEVSVDVSHKAQLSLYGRVQLWSAHQGNGFERRGYDSFIIGAGCFCIIGSVVLVIGLRYAAFRVYECPDRSSGAELE
jgi:hypothetical protein